MNTENWEIERKSLIFLDRESVLRRAENRRFFRRGQDILIALLGLSGVVIKLTKEHFAK